MEPQSRKDEFARVRQAPLGRPAQFIPELLLVRALNVEPEEKKITTIQVADKFMDAGNKLKDIFPIFTPEYIRNNLMPLLGSIPHVEDLDPWILIVAANLKYIFPKGFNFQGILQQGTISPAEMQSDLIDSAAKAILKVNEIDDFKTLPNVKADIMSYYYLMVTF